MDSRCHRRRKLPAVCGRRTRRPSRRIRPADHAGTAGAGRHGVLQSADPSAVAGSPEHHDDDLQSDRDLHRAAVGQRGFRSLLHAVTRHVLRRHVRRLLPPPEPGVGNRPRLLEGRAPRSAVSSSSSIPTTARQPSRAVQSATGGHVINFENRYRTKDGLLQVAAVVRVALHRAGTRLRRGARCHGTQSCRGRPASQRAESSRWRAGAPRPRPAPRASSWPT